ncbi:MAG: hypothetical protein AAFU03_02815, partial [Bacteroidota bacterium]
MTESLLGTSCTVVDSIFVTDLSQAPSVDAGLRDTLTCTRTNIRLGGPGTVIGPEFTYQWTGPTEANFIDSPTSANPRVTTPGVYQLRVFNTLTGCADSATVVVDQDTIRPNPSITGGGILNCDVTAIELAADSQQVNAQELLYQWSSTCLPVPIETPAIAVDCPGNYRLVVRNERTGCLRDETITIDQDIALPSAAVNPPEDLTCFNPEQTLDGRNSSPGSRIIYSWTNETEQVVGTVDTLSVTLGGDYELLVRDTVNGCLDSVTVFVSTDQTPPAVDAGPDTTALTCFQPALTLGGPGTDQGLEFNYAWTAFAAEDDTLGTGLTLDVAPPGGLFILSVFDASNGCLARDSARVLLQLDTPFVRFEPPIEFGCFADHVTIDASPTFLDYEHQLTWSGPCLPFDQDTTIIDVFCPGTYNLTIFNLENG